MNNSVKYSESDLALVRGAYGLAKEVLAGKTRGNGHPFIEHPLAVADIVANEYGLPAPALAAIFLHEATREHPEILDQITRQYSPDIVKMVQSLNKIAGIKPKDTGLEAENYRKLIVSYSRDPRVILIKLADRQEIMRSLDFFSKSEQAKKATETLFLYAPLAHQLGLYNQKKELEDLALKYTEPEAYRLISNRLKASQEERKAFIRLFTSPIEKELKAMGIVYELKSRTKSIYSIWKKMQTQQVDFDGIYDIFAIRFILESEPEKEKDLCWQVYSVVTHLYEPVIERMRDWITVPKPNGYTSLHITVRTPRGKYVEVQIRTRDMDTLAEFGLAAHWSYKGIHAEQILEQWLNKVRFLLEHPGQETENFFKNFKFNEVFVFTPEGDLKRINAGATVLDFAFAIHSNLGCKCAGARVNGKNVPIKTKLHTGDVVEILSAKNQHPTPDWLNIVVTPKAKSKIRQKLREEAGKKDLLGREILERRLKNWKIESSDDLLGDLVRFFKYKSLPDFYAAIADESIDLSAVKDAIARGRAPLGPGNGEAEIPARRVSVKKKDGDDYLIIDDKVGQFGFKLAKCCNPIMGDEIFGFVSVKDGIKIHRMTCPNAARLIERYPYRIQKVRWRDTFTDDIFQVTLRFTAYKEMGLTQEIGEIIKTLSLNLRNFSLNENRGKIEGKIQLCVNSNRQVDLLMVQLRKIKGMLKVNRATNA